MRDDVKAVFDRNGTPDETLKALMPVFAKALNCERCVMFLRDPMTDRGRAVHRWHSEPKFALDRPDRGWQPNPPDLAKVDPMYGEALVNPEALYIEDIETAGPAVLDLDFERKYFGHRALAHAPIFHKGELYGVLEPSSMVNPKKWSAADKALVAEVQKQLGPIVAEFVQQDAK